MPLKIEHIFSPNTFNKKQSLPDYSNQPFVGEAGTIYAQKKSFREITYPKQDLQSKKLTNRISQNTINQSESEQTKNQTIEYAPLRPIIFGDVSIDRNKDSANKKIGIEPEPEEAMLNRRKIYYNKENPS